MQHQPEATDHPDVLPRRHGQDDPYFLRGLIWCAICDQAMTPAEAENIRYYKCPDPECPRRHVLAQVAERLVWEHFVYLNSAVVDEISLDRRRDALRQVLSRAWVGKEVYDLYYDWRD